MSGRLTTKKRERDDDAIERDNATAVQARFMDAFVVHDDELEFDGTDEEDSMDAFVVDNDEVEFDGSDDSDVFVVLYGGHEDEAELRRWLDIHKLPQTLALSMKQLGVRSVEDVLLLAKHCPGKLEEIELLALDLIKLTQAVDLMLTEAAGSSGQS